MINVGDKIPAISLRTMTKDGPAEVTSESIFDNKKVVLFGLPGAFTPGCSAAHLPGYVVHYDSFKEKGVDTVACLSVNDAFVMSAWGEAQNAENILMLADGNGDFTKAIGMELDATGFGMGLRSKRYAMVVENGSVTSVHVDESGVEQSAAENILNLI